MYIADKNNKGKITDCQYWGDRSQTYMNNIDLRRHQAASRCSQNRLHMLFSNTKTWKENRLKHIIHTERERKTNGKESPRGLRSEIKRNKTLTTTVWSTLLSSVLSYHNFPLPFLLHFSSWHFPSLSPLLHSPTPNFVSSSVHSILPKSSLPSPYQLLGEPQSLLSSPLSLRCSAGKWLLLQTPGISLRIHWNKCCWLWFSIHNKKHDVGRPFGDGYRQGAISHDTASNLFT